MHLSTLLALLAAGAVHAAEGDDVASLAERWERQRLLQPAAAERDAADAAWAAEMRAPLLANVGRLTLAELFGGATLRSSALLGRRPWRHDEGLQFAPDPGDAFAPAWVQEALARRVAALSLPAAPPQPLRRDTWQAEDGRGAAVWSGPAVRDGVAQYRSDGSGTRIRLAIGDAAQLHALAAARGAALRVQLDDAGRPLRWDEALPLKLTTALPVWLVTPQELLPATLTTLRTGSACDGGHLELALAGPRQPPVWALLFLPDEATARAARVRRLPLPAPKPDEPAPVASQTSRLEVAWPDGTLPTLQVVAKRFGELWGSYAEQPAAKDGESPRLSAAGSPECAPR